MHRGNMRKLLPEETWTMEEYEKFISVFDVRTEEGMAFEMLYWTGIRVGELLGLLYQDVNIDSGIININKSFQVVAGEGKFVNTKTVSSTDEIVQAAYRLFKDNYRWEHPIRSLGVRGCDLVSDDMPYQLDLFISEQKREKLEKMDQVVDEIRARFGDQSIQRAFVYQDKLLAQLNAREHTVHPQGYFHG